MAYCNDHHFMITVVHQFNLVRLDVLLAFMAPRAHQWLMFSPWSPGPFEQSCCQGVSPSQGRILHLSFPISGAPLGLSGSWWGTVLLSNLLTCHFMSKTLTKAHSCFLLQVTLKLFMQSDLYEWEVIQIEFDLFHVLRYTMFLLKI